MSQKQRKLIGTILIVGIAMLYALLATTIASAKLSDASGWIHMIYFLVTGIFWVVPAMFIINWMLKPDSKKHS